MRGAGRLVLPAAVRPRLAAVLPGRHRQGARPSQPEHARRPGHRPGRHLGVRDGPRHPAHLPFCPHDQPDRRRTRRPAVPPSRGAADRLFPGPARRRFGGARARAREHPQLSHELGAHAGDRSLLRLRLRRGDVLLFAAADRGRAGGLSGLYRDFRRGDAAVPAAARREIQARRGEPGIPRRERHRDRDAEGDGGRAADAAPLGRTTGRLRRRELPRHQPRQHVEPGWCNSSASW